MLLKKKKHPLIKLKIVMEPAGMVSHLSCLLDLYPLLHGEVKGVPTLFYKGMFGHLFFA
jgi:hypothetical protein